MSSQITPSFLEYLKTTSPQLHESIETLVYKFDDQVKEIEILYNSCFGGYGFSNNFIQEYNSEHGTEYERYVFEEKVPRHDPKLIKTYKRLYRPYSSGEDTQYNKQWNGTCAEVKIETIKSNMYLIEEYDGREQVVTPESTLAMRSWVNID